MTRRNLSRRIAARQQRAQERLQKVAEKDKLLRGIREEIKAAVTIQIVKELLQRSGRYTQASPKTRRHWRRTAEERTRDLEAGSGGIGLLGALFIVFLVLKLVGTITWSWWLVTLPLWGGLALSLLSLLVLLIAALITDRYK